MTISKYLRSEWSAWIGVHSDGQQVPSHNRCDGQLSRQSYCGSNYSAQWPFCIEKVKKNKKSVAHIILQIHTHTHTYIYIYIYIASSYIHTLHHITSHHIINACATQLPVVEIFSIFRIALALIRSNSMPCHWQ